MAILDNHIRLAPGEISERRRARILSELTFMPNSESITRVYSKRSDGSLWLPRGAWQWLPKRTVLTDKRSFPRAPIHATNITLDYHDKYKSFYGQRQCIEAMFDPRNHQQGFINRQPGSGKSNIACYFIANVGTRSLVIVHTEDLMNQWLMYAQKVIPTMEVGVYRQKRDEVCQLTIAMLQTLYRRNLPPEWYRQFGCVIQDECMHAPAGTFDEVLSRCTARYRFGMSASTTRADHKEKIVECIFGPTIHKLEFQSAVPVIVKKVKSGFYMNYKRGNIYQVRRGWHNMIDQMIRDPQRNKRIADNVNEQLTNGHSVLVLSRRIEHLQLIQQLIEGKSEVLAAQLLHKGERQEIVKRFRTGQLKCVLATQLADEGLDVPILSCVALVFPGKHTDLILQQVGRALREYKGKHEAVIIDVVDDDIPTLYNHWHLRRRSYRKWGFKIVGNGIKDRYVIPVVIRDPRSALQRKRTERATKKSRLRAPK